MEHDAEPVPEPVEIRQLHGGSGNLFSVKNDPAAVGDHEPDDMAEQDGFSRCPIVR